MADYISAFQAELYALIGATLTEITVPNAGGSTRPTLFTTVQALQKSIVEFAKDGIASQGRPAPPYLFVEIGQFVPDSGLNLDNERAPVAFYYVDAASASHTPSQIYVNGRLKALKDALDSQTAAFTTFCPVEYGRIDSSPSNPITKALVAESSVQIAGGMLVYEPGFIVNIG